MAERILHLVRHAQYDQSQNDASGGSLTALGKEQAAVTAEVFRETGIPIVHCSSLRRAAETAAIIASGLPDVVVQPSRDLWEIIPAIPLKETTYFNLNFPGLTGEQIEVDRKVAENAFHRLFRPPTAGSEEEVVVCHGNIIRYFACRVLEVPLETWANMETHNCGITRVSVNSEGRLMLISLNDVGHLPARLRTFT